METHRRMTTRHMTARYLIALLLLSGLAVAVYLVLREEIRATGTVPAVRNLAGQQRIQLQQAAVLSHEFAATDDPEEREQVRRRLLDVLRRLESTHYALIEFDWTQSRQQKSDEKTSRKDLAEIETLEKVKQIYFESPWLLDTEIRTFISQVNSLLNSPPDEISINSPHLGFIRQITLSNRVNDGLDGVVEAYRPRIRARTDKLRRLAYWSFVGTFAVLGLTGIVVFHPMVRRVKHDFAQLQGLNDTLEDRVAERTELAEQRAAELEHSEALYHSLVDNLPLCVVRKDRDSRIVFANEQYCELSGSTPERILGKTDSEFYPADVAARNRENEARVMVTGQPYDNVEERMLADETSHFVEVRTTPVLDSESKIEGIQTILWDVTERVDAQREKEAMHEKLVQSERLAAIGQMVAGVAHESRNALQQIHACAQMLHWRMNGDDELRDLVADIDRAHDRLHRLFDDLRGYTAPLRLEKRKCNLKKLVEQSWESLELTEDGLSPTFAHCDGADDGLTCHADPFQIEQMFRNILENAIAAEKKVAHLDFAGIARKRFGIDAIEYVSSYFGSRMPADSVVQKTNRQAAEHRVRQIMIAIDDCGALAEANNTKRKASVRLHRSWIDIAKTLGCHAVSVRIDGTGTEAAQLQKAAESLSELAEYGTKNKIHVLISNQNKIAANARWLVSLLKQVNSENCGAAPSFRGFGSADPYAGMKLLMPFAKGIGATSHEFDRSGKEAKVDFAKMMNIVLDAGYRGYVGIEYVGKMLDEDAGIRATKDLLEGIRKSQS
eukprot:g26675.t1